MPSGNSPRDGLNDPPDLSNSSFLHVNDEQHVAFGAISATSSGFSCRQAALPPGRQQLPAHHPSVGFWPGYCLRPRTPAKDEIAA
ncbi:hypothetical protein XAC3810_530356 [Xanthomonas citri pv. citri]|uniref:Uncharacterized protein n=1 Tax=Xanthomonas citri pv. citri TaxID=611301 RepID=A0A0U5FK69_XANCI|nr:hypothetical protein XAC9322_530353 [Xanthomonas citri pv. citri]CEE34939.1 hypothetical protein XAC1083_530329 [Xanthomonas citri pv. citri]CEE44132.1 hypothetical protein XAC3810_530356 [Xanthomonas citri pv. citri]CEE47692.1 hypothetical protein XAC908_780122 [Xanthomonas citri pv. citri]CEE50702.1 hypothetical protein XACS584_1000174 [Xanthomonas citri pv. citri]